jgi:hypothetical protein
MKTITLVIISLILTLLNMNSVYAQHNIITVTSGNGGGTLHGASMNISGTIGQALVGSSHNNTLVVNSGFWYTIRSSLPTGIEPIERGNPAEFRLEQNYPNPFNPSTTIRFAIAESGFVSLKVYDLLGREVASLIHEELFAGRYNFVWDAEGIASGIYIYSLKTGSFHTNKRLILLK